MHTIYFYVAKHFIFITFLIVFINDAYYVCDPVLVIAFNLSALELSLENVLRVSCLMGRYIFLLLKL